MGTDLTCLLKVACLLKPIKILQSAFQMSLNQTRVIK